MPGWPQVKKSSGCGLAGLKLSMDLSTITELERICRESRVAATDESSHVDDLARIYEDLRSDAKNLNASHSWFSEAEFDTMLPALAQQDCIDALNQAIGDDAHVFERSITVRGLFRVMYGWSGGLLVAYRSGG